MGHIHGDRHSLYQTSDFWGHVSHRSFTSTTTKEKNTDKDENFDGREIKLSVNDLENEKHIINKILSNMKLLFPRPFQETD